jgi:DNA-binding Xre family transcriptional regulator
MVILAMIRWKLKEFLETHEITPYRLAKEVEGEVSLNAVYNMLSEDLSSVKFATLEAVIRALRKLTKRKVKVQDLLEYAED